MIDLDILFYDSEVIDSPPLKIPHPEMQNRAFVLLPLVTLAPKFHHPSLHLTVEEMLAKNDVEAIEWYSEGGCNRERG
jgi:7,8-dihydro-6-hydroxymethylpterin-pyrophosphokinase